MAAATEPSEGPTGKAPLPGWLVVLSRPVTGILGLFDEVGGTVLLVLQMLAWLVRPPYRWAQLVLALEFIGAGSTFIVALVGVFTGMAFTVSTIVGFRQFSAEGMVGGVVALGMARELAPVLASVVVTARAGSTIAAELGNMRVTEQIDAITTMGVNPIQYLVVPRVVAATLMLPLLAVCFGVAGMGGSYAVGVLWQDIDPGVFVDKIRTFVEMKDLRMLAVKSLAFGFIVSSICCKKGFYASGGARGVGEATAKAVVTSIVAIFAADYVITTMMTDI